ncbi:GNAT family N-acetyltransferase [Paenibacillus sp. NPDC058177]|uniref:GNAT family N-acetyltransferase n=1 Tax=Paenibacillus sp. NPDC058177 TaxID=3346369 RepID=UPI0036DE6D99
MSFIRIERDQYHVVKGLLSGEESAFTPFPLSILEETIDGIVYVDNQDHPQCAAVMSSDFIGGRLIGHAVNKAFNEGFISTMKDHFFVNGSANDFRLFWSTASESWDEIIFRVFGYRVFCISRTQFEFDRHVFESLGLVGNDEGMFRMDAAMLQSYEPLRREIEGLWGSIEKYLQHDVGWVAFSSDGQGIGLCHAAFIGGGLAELSIHVNESARGQGFGFQLARNFIGDCLNRGVIPNWTCDTQNVPSFRMAQKLGFKENKKYNLFSSIYTPILHEPSRT